MRPLLTLIASVIAIVVALAIVLVLCANWFAPHVPFAIEQKIAAPYAARMASPGAVERYLQRLTDTIAAAEQLPPDATVRVHYIEQPTIDAFATLGGHIVVYRGLLERIPDENTLTLLLAHEIAHVKFRHPTTALGRGVAASLVFGAISTQAGDRIAEAYLQNAGLSMPPQFTDAQEAQADTAGLETLVKIYGHAGGSGEWVGLLNRLAVITPTPAILTTHPHFPERASEVAALIRERGWASDGARVLLPAEIRWQLGKSPPDVHPAANVPVDVD